jgi:hypothetical protein
LQFKNSNFKDSITIRTTSYSTLYNAYSLHNAYTLQCLGHNMDLVSNDPCVKIDIKNVVSRVLIFIGKFTKLQIITTNSVTKTVMKAKQGSTHL